MKMVLVDYDVWGNETDGYDVNMVYKTDLYFDIPEDASAEDIEQILKTAPVGRYSIPYFPPDARIEIETWNYPYIELSAKDTGMPFARLEPAD